VNGTDNHFIVGFLHQNNKSACLMITTGRGFQDREPVFNELTTSIFFITGKANRFLVVFTGDDISISGMCRDDGLCLSNFMCTTMDLL
jgi:hypothetical protein